MSPGAHPYPEQSRNPVPHGGPPERWREWAQNLTMLSHFDARCTVFEPGRAVFTVDSSPVELNPNGALHGGALAALFDDALGAVFMSVAAADELPATASLTVDYLRPAFLPFELRASVPSRGRSLIHCDAAAVDIQDRVCGRARAIMAVKRLTAEIDGVTPRR